MPVGDDATLIGVAPADGAILDLGAGVGRIADPLARLGHRVVAVDDLAEMLGHVCGAITVHSSIESLRLPDRFGVVLLGNHLICTSDLPKQRDSPADDHVTTVGLGFYEMIV